MRLALGDVTRLHIVAHYEEAGPGRLVLILAKGYASSTSVQYHLRRLYTAYVDLLDFPETDPVMELWHTGNKLGEYTREGLVAGPEDHAPLRRGN